MLANGATAAAATIKKMATPAAIALCCPVAGVLAIISGKSCSCLWIDPWGAPFPRSRGSLATSPPIYRQTRCCLMPSPSITKGHCNHLNATLGRRQCPLMGWSGRAPAPPASEAGKGRQRQGASHASDTQYGDRRDRHRYRQELVP